MQKPFPPPSALPILDDAAARSSLFLCVCICACMMTRTSPSQPAPRRFWRVADARQDAPESSALLTTRAHLHKHASGIHELNDMITQILPTRPCRVVALPFPVNEWVVFSATSTTLVPGFFSTLPLASPFPLYCLYSPRRPGECNDRPFVRVANAIKNLFNELRMRVPVLGVWVA
ncbi:hypothetical protein F5148DRAFT_298418 [Russula earlei]|uniref:Uncharacterized protein n=1 Tax=Russula earlei TaxID=71964 RepID=A0ACC0UKB1_9AGAM|nr:hypothetical protein F5148DRAFT_298418 [Russula earlei]